MELKKYILLNKGMSLDISISKQLNEEAFENHNIRIISQGDNTLLSITNIQGPKLVNSEIKGIDETIRTYILVGSYINKTNEEKQYVLLRVLYNYLYTQFYDVNSIKEGDEIYVNGKFDLFEGDSSLQKTTDFDLSQIKYTIDRSYLIHKELALYNFVDDIVIDSNLDMGFGPITVERIIRYYDVENNNTVIYGYGYSNPSNTPINLPLNGVIVGKCYSPEYLILFTCSKNEGTNWIYRIDLNSYNELDNSIKVNILFKGQLNFKLNKPIDTLFFYESETILKVYWVDGWTNDESVKDNNPRVINIITPNERLGKWFESYTNPKTFEFYPVVNKLPKFNVEKLYTGYSALPAGVIQYFVSYYNRNGAESLIANSSYTYTIDYENRGATAEETGTCSFNITISNIDASFDYLRLYSVIRTSINGELIVLNVLDYELTDLIKDENTSITIFDNGVNNELLEPTYIYYVGGTPFFAKTLTQKDNTAFFGNIKLDNLVIPQDIIDEFTKRIVTKEERTTNGKTLLDVHKWAKDISFKQATEELFTKKSVQPELNSYYPYNVNNSVATINNKTFKKGEIYRFGILFQTERGLWTNALWIGDRECNQAPIYKDSAYYLTDAEYRFPKFLVDKCKEAGYVNYRILIANPETSNGRKIVSQGILCPTLFSYGLRATNAPYSLPSWVMRPRNGKIAYHHFEPLNEARQEGAEIANDYRTKCYPEPADKIEVNFEEDKEGNEFLITLLGILYGHKIGWKTIRANAKIDGDGDFVITSGKTITEGVENKNNWVDCAQVLEEKIYKPCNVNNYIDLLPPVKSLEKLGSKSFWSAPWIVGAASIIAVCLTYVTAGLASPLIGALGLLGSIAIATSLLMAASLILSLNATIVSALTLAFVLDATVIVLNQKANKPTGLFNKPEFNSMEDWQKELYTHGWVMVGNNSFLSNKVFQGRGKDVVTLNSQTIFGILTGSYQVKCIDYRLEPTWREELPDSFILAQVHLLNHGDGEEGSKSDTDSKIREKFQDYFIDESILTFHSPDISDNYSLFNNKKYKLRIIGSALLNGNYSTAEINVETATKNDKGGLLETVLPDYRLNSSTNLINPLYSGLVYTDSGWNSDVTEDAEGLSNSLVDYKMFLWHYNNSIIGHDDYSVLKDKTFFNHLYSINTTYFDNPIEYKNLSRIKVCDEITQSVNLNNNQLLLYTPNFETLIIDQKDSDTVDDSKLPTIHYYADLEKLKPFLDRSTKIEFKTTPHIVFDLSKDSNYKELLPVFEDDLKFNYPYMSKFSIDKLYGESRSISDNVFFNSPWLTRENFYPTQTKYFDIIKYDFRDNRSLHEIIYDFVAKNLKNPSFLINLILKNINLGIDKKLKLELYNTSGKITNISFPNDIISGKFYYLFHPLTGFPDNRPTDLLNCTWFKAKKNITQQYCTDIPLYYLLYVWLFLGYNLNTANPSTVLYFEESTGDIPLYMMYFVEHVNNIMPALLPGLLQTKLDDAYNGYCYGLWIGDKTIASHADFHYEKIPIIDVLEYVVKNYKSQIDLFPISLRERHEYSTITIKDYKLNSDGTLAWVAYDFIEDNKTIYYENNIKSYKRFTWDSNGKHYLKYPMFYNQKIINTSSINHPYLFIGELYLDITHLNLYGGYSDSNMLRLEWLPASAVHPIGENVDRIEGDTYYQRWDCLKTYPKSEETVNKVVDITSVMLESHINLDERTDENRGKFNIMSRPENFNLFNPVYSQYKTIFQYGYLNTINNTNKYRNLFTWSLYKNYNSLVDSWTNVTLQSIGLCKYPITKLISYNDALLALTEHSLEAISYNEKGLASIENTTGVTSVEIMNNSKVNGVTTIMSYTGSFNQTYLVTQQGLYFIDDSTNNLLVKIGGKEGLEIIPLNKLTGWFKDNIVPGTYTYTNQESFHLEYDPNNNDVYILNNKYCLIYNEILQTFTSFLDFLDTYTLFKCGNRLMSVAFVDRPLIYQMYAGDYNTTYLDKPINYSMEYRVNPNMLTDKVFTNVEFIADTNVNDINSSKSLVYPLNLIRAWNEYLDTGLLTLRFERHLPSNMKQKFRIWRADIPRDKNSKWARDRIRNPWIHLYLGRDNSDGNKEKMELHNLTVLYME